MSTETTIQVLSITTGTLAIMVGCLVYCLIDSERVLNWFIRKYNSEPSVIIPPKRRLIHRLIMRQVSDLPSENFVPSPYYSKHI